MKKLILMSAVLLTAAQAYALTPGRVVKASSGTYIADSIIRDDGTGVAIGAAVVTGQKLAVDGTIKSISGGFVFPDGSTQTVAASAWHVQAYSGPEISRSSSTAVGVSTVAVPANTFDSNGDTMRITASGTGAAFTAGLQIKVGGVTIAGTAMSVENTLNFITCTVTRAASNSQNYACIVQGANAGGTVNTLTPANGTLTFTDSSSVDVTAFLTGDGTTGFSKLNNFVVEYP